MSMLGNRRDFRHIKDVYICGESRNQASQSKAYAGKKLNGGKQNEENIGTIGCFDSTAISLGY